MTKTKTQATSGEWLIDPDAPLDILAGWDTGPCIGAAFANADAGISQQQAEANTRMMAASKRLYEALKALTDTAESRFEGLEIVALVPQDLRRDIQLARAALAAAEPKAGA